MAFLFRRGAGVLGIECSEKLKAHFFEKGITRIGVINTIPKIELFFRYFGVCG
jgi:hypothetical protein